MEREALLRLREQILELGAARAELLPVSEITFHPEFRDMCRSNACGMYGTCWMCPPLVGEAEDLIAEARLFDTAMVYQTVSPLEDSFDIEGMLAAGERQNRLAQKIQALLREQGGVRFLHLGAGGCRRCAVCSKADEKPCRFPEEAISSLEAYCMDVTQLAKRCGMPYISGANTVTYFGALLV